LAARLRTSPTQQAEVESPDRLQEPAADSSEKPQGLAKCKQVLWAVIAFERLCYDVLAALHAAVAEARQSEGIPFACKDGVEDPHATYTSNVVQDPMNLQIHLIESLLHMQDVLCCNLNQTAAMSPK
jgi:hypothetical protein